MSVINKREGLWRVWVVLWALWALFFAFIGLMIGLEGHLLGGLALLAVGIALPPLIWAVGEWVYRGFVQPK